MSTPIAAFDVTISFTSTALLGGRGAGGVAETWLVSHGDGDRRALLPGSALRGVLRHASLRFAAARGIECLQHDAAGDGRSAEPIASGTGVGPSGSWCDCLTCVLFGGRGRPGRLRVRSASLAAPQLVEATRVAIDRTRGTAAEHSLWSSRRVLGAFEVRIELDPADAASGADGHDEPKEHLAALLAWLEATGIAIGQSKSTGGQASLRASAVIPRPAVSVDPRPGPARRWSLRFTALEPLRLAGLRDRVFFQHGYGFVPAATLTGALGWGLVRAGGDALATAAFGDAPDGGVAWVSEAWPPDAGWSWRASQRQCRDCGAFTDVAVDDLARALVVGPGPAGNGEICPRCHASGTLRRRERGGARMLVSGHTEIELPTGRVREGRLFQQRLCAPGTRFVAELLGPDWVAEAIRDLRTVTVGGARRRGFGLVEITEVEPQAATPLDQHLDALDAALHARGVEHAEPVAIFDMVTSAHVPEPMVDVMRARDVELVTGEAEVNVLGGWDERRGSTRALREVIGRGSWMALRGNPESLASLDGMVLADREGWCPLWLEARRIDDLEGESSPR